MKYMDFTSMALKNLFSKPATKNYPEEPAVYPERSRGHIEIDIDDCIMCGMCMRKCPSGAITVDRATKTWSIERMGCVQCENCVTGCPKNCLHIKPGYTEPSTEKTVDSYSQPIAEKPKAEEKGTDEASALTSGKVVNNIDTCILCGLCARKCPQECITVDRKEEKTWSINRDDCIQCGACIDACIKFHSLSFAEDDGEKGIVTIKKEA
ncbi:MAG: 4Fe-4S dicluster domain-containing protein [Eubacterium sp.]